jgi:hypothetical protein
MDRHLPTGKSLLEEFLARVYGISGALAMHIEHLETLHDHAELDYF